MHAQFTTGMICQYMIDDKLLIKKYMKMMISQLQCHHSCINYCNWTDTIQFLLKLLLKTLLKLNTIDEHLLSML